LWSKWMEILRRWGKELPRGWVEAGLWRWRKLPKDQVKHAVKLGLLSTLDEVETWENI